jgi:D-alanyl-D-alanine carboxypeptidase
MLRSGNDAALTLASHTLSNTDEFIEKMNEKAKEIGMKNTIFQNPHGLDEKTKNYSTAYDMALLSKYAFHNKQYRKIVSTKKYLAKSSKKSYVWYNRMSLINTYKKCIGGKNGYTPSAGKTLVSFATKKNLTLTIVSLNDPNIYSNHKNLYEKYFTQYKNYTILKKQKSIVKSRLYSGKLFIKKKFVYPLKLDELSKINTIVEIYPNTNKDIVGNIKIYLDNKRIGERKIYQKKREYTP